MSDVAIAQTQTDKPKRLEVRGKLRHALDAMIWEGLTYDVAARTYNLHIRSMRKALGKPHVLAYLNSERQVLRASVSPKNIHRLVEIRDAADNMPAVNAIKVLEQLGDEQQQRGSAISASPGVTIRIVNVIQQAPAGDATFSTRMPQRNEINDLQVTDVNGALTAAPAAVPALPDPALRGGRGENR